MSSHGKSDGYRNAYTRSSTHASLVRDYADLSAADINLLTSVLSHAPKPSSPLTDMYKDGVKQQIAQLPLHLRSKIPWYTTSCSTHSKLNPLPIKDMLEAIKQEVEYYVLKTWAELRSQDVLRSEQSRMIQALEGLSALWTKPKDLITERHWEYEANKCGACILSRIGGNIQVVTAIGASFVGRFKRSVWKRSKRLVWIEAWIRNAVEEKSQEEAIRKMWTLGKNLRKVRKHARRLDENGDEGDDDEEPIAQSMAVPPAQQASHGHPANNYAAFSGNPFNDQAEAASLFEMSGGLGPQSIATPSATPSKTRRSISTRRNDSAIFSHVTAADKVFASPSAKARSSRPSTATPSASRQYPRTGPEVRDSDAIFSPHTTADEVLDSQRGATSRGISSAAIASTARGSEGGNHESSDNVQGLSSQIKKTSLLGSHQSSSRRGAESRMASSTAQNTTESRTSSALFSGHARADDVFGNQETPAPSRAASAATSKGNRRSHGAGRQPRVQSAFSGSTTAEDDSGPDSSRQSRQSCVTGRSTTAIEVIGMYGQSNLSRVHSSTSRQQMNVSRTPRVESWLSEQTTIDDVFDSRSFSHDRGSRASRHSATPTEVIGMYGHSTTSRAESAAIGRHQSSRQPRVDSGLSEQMTADEIFDTRPSPHHHQSRAPRQSISNTELIGLYDHSTVSLAPSAVPQALFASAASRRRPDPELARHPRQKMPPITSVGSAREIDSGSEDPEVRKKLKRDKLIGRPAFRKGTNGQIKGPGDTVDDLSIVTGMNSLRTNDSRFF